MHFARKEKFRLWESSCFELLGDGKYGLLLIQKVDVRWYFLQHGIPFFWVRKSSYFELFRDRKYGHFLIYKADGKLIVSWYFWTFDDIPGLGKYAFLCSEKAAKFSQKDSNIWIFTNFVFARNPFILSWSKEMGRWI